MSKRSGGKRTRGDGGKDWTVLAYIVNLCWRPWLAELMILHRVYVTSTGSLFVPDFVWRTSRPVTLLR